MNGAKSAPVISVQSADDISTTEYYRLVSASASTASPSERGDANCDRVVQESELAFCQNFEDGDGRRL